jgi:hypothetical protein
MKKILTSEIFLGIIASISILLVWAFIWATEPEQWYAGMHDSQCEKTLYDEPCECYERLVAADKAKYGKK